MAKTSGNSFVKWLVVAMVIIAMFGGAKGGALCGIDSTKINLCYEAVTGKSPPKPNEKCCEVVKNVNLPCLCSYKYVLPAFGINPTNALNLPSRCGLKTPNECRVP